MIDTDRMRRIYGGELPSSGPETRIMLRNAVTDIDLLCEALDKERASNQRFAKLVNEFASHISKAARGWPS